MTSKSVNLVLPGLFKSFQKSEFDASKTTQFNLIQQFITQSNYHSVCDKKITSFPVDYTNTYPLASYENDEDLDTDVNVLYAEPVSIEVKSDHIIAFPVLIDSGNNHTIEQIIDLFNQHFSQDGLCLKYLPSGRIICKTSKSIFPEMTSAYAVYGRDMKHFLPHGEESRFWLRVFNEAQMFLHEYIDNQDKLFGDQVLNGFWFWGAGSTIHSELDDDGFISNSSWSKGFCEFNNVEQLKLSDVSESSKQNFHIIDESLLLASSCGDMDSWVKELTKIESELLIPLLELLKAGEISKINIHDTPETFYQFKKIHRYRFFRKNKSLSDICVVDA